MVAEATSGDAGISSDADAASTGPAPDPDPDPDPNPEPHPDAAATCDALARPPSQPAVVLDVEVACTRTRFADYGARVALGEDAAHLAVGAFYDSFLFDVTGAGATRDEDAPSRPPPHFKLARYASVTANRRFASSVPIGEFTNTAISTSPGA